MTLPRVAGLQSSGTWKGRNTGQDTKQIVPMPWSAPPTTHREGRNWREHTLYTCLSPRGSHRNHNTGFFPRAFSRWRGGKESVCQCRRYKRHKFEPWIRKILVVRNGNPLQYSCLENPIDRGAWRATVYGVTKNWTRLSTY